MSVPIHRRAGRRGPKAKEPLARLSSTIVGPAGTRPSERSARPARARATARGVGVVLARRLLDGAQALTALAAAAVGTLLVPRIRLRQAEDPAEIALALESPQRGFEVLVGAYGDLDHYGGVPVGSDPFGRKGRRA